MADELSVTDIKHWLETLRNRKARERATMRELDKWRHLVEDEVAADIWGDVPVEERGETVVKPEINAVTDTMVALFAAQYPQITIQQKNRVSLSAFNEANFNERLGLALFHEIDRHREESLLAGSAEDMFHRGKAIVKIIWLDPETRGEEREPAPEALFALPADEQPALTPDGEVVIDGGVFPVLLDLVDPLEAFYQTSPTTGEITRFVHEFEDTWDALAEMFPDLPNRPEFGDFSNRNLLTTGNRRVTVIDYWDKEINAIIIDNKFYKEPTEHNYPWVPFVAESGRLRKRRDQNRSSYRESIPFCKPMLKAVRDLSYANSLLFTYMKEIGLVKLVHEGLPDDGSSPWTERETDPATGAITGLKYSLHIDNSPGSRILPLFYNKETGVAERLRYLEPPAMVDHWRAFAAERNADVEIVSFGRAFLSGVLQADLSGYSVSLQKQLSMARIEPYKLALNRLFSRAMHKVFELIASEWEGDGRGEVPFLIRSLTDEETIQLDRSMAANVGVVDFQFLPEITDDREAQSAMTVQEFQSGLMSPIEAINQLGHVQDPHAHWEEIIFTQEALSNPLYRKKIAANYARDNNLFSEEGQAEIEQEVAVFEEQQRMEDRQVQQQMAAILGQQPSPEDMPQPGQGMSPSSNGASQTGGQ